MRYPLEAAAALAGSVAQDGASYRLKVEALRPGTNEPFAIARLDPAGRIGIHAADDPVRLLREQQSRVRPMEFSFYGPTCDDLDHMAGPFLLPADVQAGDYVEIGMLGAYGCAMRTGFNGFGSDLKVVAQDEPMASLYRGDRADPRVSDNVVSLR